MARTHKNMSGEQMLAKMGKKVEKTKEDKLRDKRLGLKEGSKKDKRLDLKQAMRMMKKA